MDSYLAVALVGFLFRQDNLIHVGKEGRVVRDCFAGKATSPLVTSVTPLYIARVLIKNLEAG